MQKDIMSLHACITIAYLLLLGKLLYTVNLVLDGVQVSLVFTPLPTTFTAFTVIRYTVWFDPLKGTHIVVET